MKAVMILLAAYSLVSNVAMAAPADSVVVVNVACAEGEPVTQDIQLHPGKSFSSEILGYYSSFPGATLTSLNDYKVLVMPLQEGDLACGDINKPDILIVTLKSE